MIKVQVYLDYIELHKIVNGLLVLRQKQVELQHIIVVDNTNIAHRAIIQEIVRLDRLISKMNRLLEQIEGDTLNIPEIENDSE